ncbi:type II secretion system GspH family protein [Verrucomicrobia bacterium]|nr:type II secretion system GspH family protein [Verrucomicrobiota bacterium]
MKLKAPSRKTNTAGFTLIEMLVVISIIGILASIAIPVVAKVKLRATIAQTKLQMGALQNGIAQYKSMYSRYPLINEIYAQQSDYTFGTRDQLDFNSAYVQRHSDYDLPSGTAIERCNRDIMGTLAGLTNFRDGSQTANTNHQYNIKKDIIFSAKQGESGVKGVGEDGIYRDPWGSPYIISIDANFDNRVYDSFYRRSAVSQKAAGATAGLNGLVNTIDANGNANNYSLQGDIMIWSFGPDKTADPNIKADTETTDSVTGNKISNSDNVLSWAD